MAPSDVWDPEFGPGLHHVPIVSVSGEMRCGPGYDFKMHSALTAVSVLGQLGVGLLSKLHTGQK